jgi:hypothetical protein
MPEEDEVAGAAVEPVVAGAAEAEGAPEARGDADAEAAAPDAEAEAFGGAPASLAPPTCARTLIEKSVGRASANTVIP